MIMTSAVAAMTHAISPESSATVRAPPKQSWRGKQTRSITILPWLGAPAKPEVMRKSWRGWRTIEGVLDTSAFSSRSPPLGRDGLSCKIDRQKSSVIDLTSPGCSDHRVRRPQNVRERKCDPNPGQPGPRGRNLCRFDHRRVRRVPDGPPGPINLLVSHAEHAGGKQSGGFRP